MKNDNMKNQYRVNEQIRVREVRIVGDGGSTVVPTRQALDMARDQGVDLVEISPNANPPVCRLIDYSKFLYQQKRATRYVRTFSSVVVPFSSRSRVRCCCCVSPTTWRITVR